MVKKMLDTIFIDAGFIIALINEYNAHYQKAIGLANQFEYCPFITIDAILLEV